MFFLFTFQLKDAILYLGKSSSKSAFLEDFFHIPLILILFPTFSKIDIEVTS